jgi:hypothetical protein
LPHFRIRPSGRFTFFREQVVGWVLAQQQGGISHGLNGPSR